MAATNQDNVSQPNAATMQNNTADSQIPDLNLEYSLGELYTENSNQNPLARSSTEAGVLRLQEPQMAPQMAAAPVRSVRLPRASSLPTESGLRRGIRPKDILALRRLETKQKIAQRQMSQQPASFPEAARVPAAPAAPASPEAPVAPAAPAALAALIAPAALAAPTAPAALAAIVSCASEGPGASETVLYHYKAEGYLTVSCAAKGALSVETLPWQRDVKPLMATSATAATTKEVGSSQSTQENPSKRVKLDSGDDMISVRTTGVGGRQIEGILYARDGEVNILCVCHGLFHSPAAFVKHAGGKEVTNPLRHIIVCPSSD